MHIHGTEHLDNGLARRPSSNEYFDIFNNEVTLWSPFPWEEEYRSAHWCIKHSMSTAAINEHFGNPTMETVSNITSSHTCFKWFHEMSYAMGFDC